MVIFSGPQPNWDPDIVEALDDDFDFDNPDNQLDDDFISKAMAPGGEGMDYKGEGCVYLHKGQCFMASYVFKIVDCLSILKYD